jgi:Protein of unknown function (DUF3102)
MAEKIVGFNYEALDAKHRKTTAEDAKAIRGLLERTAETHVEIGRRLWAVKQRIGRSSFQAWLRAEFRWSQSVASNYMQAASTFGTLDCLEKFQPSALFELSRRQTPKKAIENAIGEARSGQTITRKRAHEIIASFTPAGQPSPLTQDAVRRFRSSLNLLADRLDALIGSLKDEEVDLLVDQLSNIAAQLRSARQSKPDRATAKRHAPPKPLRRPAVAVASVRP